MTRWMLLTPVLCLALAAGCAVPAVAGDVAAAEGDRVTVTEQPLTLPWYTSVPRYKEDPRTPGAIWAQRGTEQRDGDRTFDSVVLENRYLRITVLPEAGGAVARVIHKPSGDDFFFMEGRAKDWVPFWESGIKVNFPWREHSVKMEGQEASWRTIEHDDGAVTLTMWMEFSRHTDPWEGAMFGAFTNLLLSQSITLRPGENLLSISYRVTNPSAYRQGRRIWTDAFLPRFHTVEEGVVHGPDAPPEGKTRTQWIFPAAYVADHRGLNVRRLTEDDLDIANRPHDHNSIFALDTAAGFVGAYYPGVRINRLRLGDPSVAPGTKLYWQRESGYNPGTLTSHMYNFLELWGGSDHIMEGVENWIEPGHTWSFTHHYTMVAGIGRADYANEDAVVHLDSEGGRLEVAVPRLTRDVEAELDGRRLGRIAAIRPEQPARFVLPEDVEGGHLVLRGDGRVLIDRELPIVPEGNPDDHDRIVSKSDLGWAEGNERIGDQMDYGRTLNRAARMYPAGSLGRGRVQYRLGRIDAAIDTLEAFVEAEPGEGEGWHLLGVARLEQGDAAAAAEAFQRAVDAEQPYPAAYYFQALARIEAGEGAAARDLLLRLLDEQPGHYEARLLAAWLLADRPTEEAVAGETALEEAKALVELDPADPRALWVWKQAAAAAGDERTQQRAAQALDRMMAETGAPRRLEEFQAATEGRFMPPQRLEQFN